MAFATEVPGSAADSRAREDAAHPDAGTTPTDTPRAHSEHRPVGAVERSTAPFRVVSEHVPAGDQPTAIAELDRRLRAGEQDVVAQLLAAHQGGSPQAVPAWSSTMVGPLLRGTEVTLT